MKGRKAFTLIELLVVIAIIAVLAAILFPVFSRARKAAQKSTCQSNLQQIGKSIKTYLTDWDDTFPTNRILGGKGGMSVGGMSAYVKLSAPTTDPTTGKPLRAQIGTGISWVEGLYNYMEGVTTRSDASSIWRCPAARNTNALTPTGTNYVNDTTGCSAVTYAFNYNLIEQPEGVINTASNLMMVREMDRLVDSVLRPASLSIGSSAVPPDCPFLCKSDTNTGGTPITDVEPRLHDNGSHILFADSHVKSFSTESMPENSNISANNNWSGSDQRWFNFYWASPSNATQERLNRSIAITP